MPYVPRLPASCQFGADGCGCGCHIWPQASPPSSDPAGGDGSYLLPTPSQHTPLWQPDRRRRSSVSTPHKTRGRRQNLLSAKQSLNFWRPPWLWANICRHSRRKQFLTSTPPAFLWKRFSAASCGLGGYGGGGKGAQGGIWGHKPRQASRSADRQADRQTHTHTRTHTRTHTHTHTQRATHLASRYREVGW